MKLFSVCPKACISLKACGVLTFKVLFFGDWQILVSICISLLSSLPSTGKFSLIKMTLVQIKTHDFIEYIYALYIILYVYVYIYDKL